MKIQLWVETKRPHYINIELDYDSLLIEDINNNLDPNSKAIYGIFIDRPYKFESINISRDEYNTKSRLIDLNKFNDETLNALEEAIKEFEGDGQGYLYEQYMEETEEY